MATPARSARGRRSAVVGVILVSFWAITCTSSDPARAGADRFVDSYYVEIDLPTARERAVGLARAKVDRQIQLLKGVEAPEENAKPRVNYRMLEEVHSTTSERRGFVYELTVTLPGGEQVQARTLVTVGQEDGGWRAVNFEDIH